MLSCFAAVSRQRAVACGLSLGLALGCSSPTAEPTTSSRSGIVGGEPVSAGAWPMVVFLDNGCTGVLVAPDLVVYAAHCGTRVSAAWFGDVLDADLDSAGRELELRASPGTRSIAIGRCELYPAWQLGNGSDIAFCTLAEPAIDETEVIRPAFGCSLSVVGQGVSTTLVGFGRAGPDLPFGTKRTLVSPLLAADDELEIGTDAAGTCTGDSGSPAFLRVPTGTGSEWQVLGILSSGITGAACGVGYYTPLARWANWLSTSSGRNVLPCFDRSGSWAPSASCLRPAITEAGTPSDPTATPAYSDACGKPFDPAAQVAFAAHGGCSLVCAASAGKGRALLALPFLLVGLALWRRRPGAER